MNRSYDGHHFAFAVAVTAAFVVRAARSPSEAITRGGITATSSFAAFLPGLITPCAKLKQLAAVVAAAVAGCRGGSGAPRGAAAGSHARGDARRGLPRALLVRAWRTGRDRARCGRRERAAWGEDERAPRRRQGDPRCFSAQDS